MTTAIAQAAVKERGIIFSAEMIRALLEDRKTQTRRIVSPNNCAFGSAPKEFWQHADFSRAWVDGKKSNLEYLHVPCHVSEEGHCERCDEMGWPETMHRLWPCWWPLDSFVGPESERPPYRLWVRETFARNENQLSDSHMDSSIVYRADGEARATDNGTDKPWTSPIHMPRWASRITLEITKVRVERLQEISHKDALAEGVTYDVSKPDGSPLARYRELWDKLNKARGFGWDVNAFCWVLEFRRITNNSGHQRDSEVI